MFIENCFVLMLGIWCQIFVDNYENAYKRELSRLTAKMDGRIIINFVHSYLLKHSCKIVTVIWGRRFTSSTVGHLLFNVIVAVPLNGFVNTGFINFCHICKFKSYVHTHLDHLHFKFESLLIKKKKKMFALLLHLSFNCKNVSI